MQDLDNFNNEMNLSGKNVYVGHRYVPKIMGDWDNTQIYEPLSIVQFEGNSFTSRQYVPSGIEITNEEFWASTGNYNAQVEQYRQEFINVNKELVNARNGESTLNARLDKDKQETDSKKLDKIKVIPEDVNGHGINVSTPDLQNITYDSVFIDATKYGVLWNNGTVGGQDLRITNSKIMSDISDAIELNTWGLSDETDFFRNIIVTDNFISTGLVGGSSAGFAIGAASPQNLIVSNNVISQSSNEGVHIEGLARNTIISSNVIDNAMGDGITVSGDVHEQGLVEPTTLSNNAIRSGTDKTGSGIKLVYSTSSIYGYGLLNSNKIIGFDRGITMASNIDVTGTYIEDCNIAIQAYKSGIEINGVLETKNTPKILVIGANSVNETTHLDGFKTNDVLNVDNIITKQASTTVTLNKMKYRTAVVEKGTDNYSTSVIAKSPKYFKGIIKLTTTNGANFSAFTADCEIKNGVLSVTEITSVSGLSYGKVTLSLVEGYLYAKLFTTLTMSGQHFNVSLDGNIVY